ncbi:MAG TPA: hypothetical protein GXZ66_08905 [Clostridiaceae bacterium]|jgi:cell division protein FtsB|nr:hypothetical protein [Clostridiaceae bacterium]
MNSAGARELHTEDYDYDHAYDYGYDFDYDYEERIEQSPEFAVLRELKIKRNNAKVKANLVIKVSIIIILGLIIAFRYASITELGYKVNAMQNQLDEIKAENSRLETNIARQMNLAEISEIAINELGMQKPQSYQIVRINVVPTDQTEIHEMKFTKDENNTPWYKNVLDEIKAFLGIC